MTHIERSNRVPVHARALAHARSLAQFVYRVIPRHTVRLVRYETYLAWVRLTSRNADTGYRNSKGLLLNLGCGRQGRQGWVNVDSSRLPGVNLVFDCRKRLPFPECSAQGIFTEHFVEHLEYTEEVPYFLSECHRVLSPGGVLRIVVPDAEQYLRAYVDEGWARAVHLRKLDKTHVDPSSGCRYLTKMELVNMVFRQGGQHRFAYDFETLSLVLQKSGFGTVLRQAFNQSMMSELCIDAERRARESLYVEAVKSSS
jgi:predicted SAM-dependent methyltransferase